MPKLAEERPDTPAKKISLASLLLNLTILMVALAAILFISAGHLYWLQGWLFLIFYTGFLAFYGLWTLRKDPEQLKERSQTGKNTKKWDKAILTVYTVLLIGMLILAGLDSGRFHWAPATPALQGTGWIGAVTSGFLIWRSASVNTFLSRTVRIQDDRGQRVIDTGPYGLVRHPMYLGIIFFMLSVPLQLGSLWALVPGAMIATLFIVRTGLEDRTLYKELEGYQEYARRVRYRLIPLIW